MDTPVGKVSDSTLVCKLRIARLCPTLVLSDLAPSAVALSWLPIAPKDRRSCQILGEMSVSADHTYPDGITDEYLISQALMGEPGGDGARHGITPHALQARPHASPASHAHASHAHASHAGVHLDVCARTVSTHAHSHATGRWPAARLSVLAEGCFSE